MTPELAWIFALFRPRSKTDARCGWLPAARAARTLVEGLIWLFSLASGRIPPVDCAWTRDNQTLHAGAGGGCGRSSASRRGRIPNCYSRLERSQYRSVRSRMPVLSG